MIYYLIHWLVNCLILGAVGYILLAAVFGPWMIVDEIYHRIKDRRK